MGCGGRAPRHTCSRGGPQGATATSPRSWAGNLARDAQRCLRAAGLASDVTEGLATFYNRCAVSLVAKPCKARRDGGLFGHVESRGSESKCGDKQRWLWRDGVLPQWGSQGPQGDAVLEQPGAVLPAFPRAEGLGKREEGASPGCCTCSGTALTSCPLPSCNLTCPLGHYGANCAEACSCHDGTCDPLTGACHMGECRWVRVAGPPAAPS